MKSISIVGATGYTGSELLRLLVAHPEVNIQHVTARRAVGQRCDSWFPNLRGFLDLSFTAPDNEALAESDLVFFATPNGVAMEAAPALLDAGVKVIDLAADYRIKDVDVWAKWYGMTHASPELVQEAVYGLPELYREDIRDARLVANPGCYPTAVTLGFSALLKADLISPQGLIADAKSGTSGAGRKEAIPTLFAEAGDNFKAYGAAGHRHLPEISAQLTQLVGDEVGLTFIPHLLPQIRGIHATLYGRKTSAGASISLESAHAALESHYANEPFVDVMPLGSHPETRSVKGSNMCRLAIHEPPNGNLWVVLSVIDNLVKGAAGQAVQNMNLMLGFPENTGLDQVALMP